MKNVYKSLVEKFKERRSLRRHGLRWEDNIKIGCRLDDLAQNRVQICALVNTVIYLHVPQRQGYLIQLIECQLRKKCSVDCNYSYSAVLP
jgi:hypothetical protein